MKLFEDNKNLVYAVWNRYFSTPKFAQYKDDLIQEGFIALWKAAAQYDDSRGNKFSTYAYICILHKMRDFLKHFNDITVVPLEVITSYEEDSEHSLIIQEIISQSLARFSNKDQLIIRHYLSGYSQRHIARIMDVPYKHILTIIKDFRNTIQEEQMR